MCAVYGPKRFYAEVIVTVFKTSRVAKRDDFHSKLFFSVKIKGQWNAISGPKVADGNVAMRTNFSGRFAVEMRAYGQKFVKFCTLTHAAKLVELLVGAQDRR